MKNGQSKLRKCGVLEMKLLNKKYVREFICFVQLVIRVFEIDFFFNNLKY